MQGTRKTDDVGEVTQTPVVAEQVKAAAITKPDRTKGRASVFKSPKARLPGGSLYWGCSSGHGTMDGEVWN